jgi:hypothetical protein
MKTFTLTLCLLVHSAKGFTAQIKNPGFTCKTYADSLRCRSEAVTDLKRPPQWELYPEGQGYIDKARGWNVTLYPPAPGHRYMVLLRVYLPDRIAIVTCHLKDGECRGPEPDRRTPVTEAPLRSRRDLGVKPGISMPGTDASLPLKSRRDGGFEPCRDRLPGRPEGLRDAAVPLGLWGIGGRLPGIEMPGSMPRSLRDKPRTSEILTGLLTGRSANHSVR